MTVITNAHFGGNIVLTRDTADVSGPYEKMLNEISFSSFRYPGGSVTEEQTWENGGLARMFGSPMSHESDNYVMTIREALQLSIDHDASMTIVVPTFQFWNAENKTFDKSGFDRYLGELERALTEYPAAKIEAFEIGNEYWAEISAADYGAIASHEIMALAKFDATMSAKLGSCWEDAAIGVQAGASWRGSGVPESTTIAKAISVDARPFISKIYQHGYPDATRDTTGSIDHSLETMRAFLEVEGFSQDLEFSLSEFNMHARGPMGTDQAGHWIESFAQYVQGGVDEIYMWGTQYEWLSSKMYDALPHRGEGADVIATPMGQIYDLASNYLVGKSVIDDSAAVRDIELSAQINVTGFEGGGQRVVFLHNRGNDRATVDLSEIDSNAHVTIHHMTPADSPLTQRNDESDRSARPGPVDARGDMSVRSGAAISDELTLASGDVATIIISDPRLGLVIEGAHNVTDARTGLVNDHIVGGMGNDIIRGHVGDDNLGGAGGNDVITGGEGDDRIAGGNGNDVLISDQGSDSLSGGAGDDLILIEQADASETTSVALGDGRDVILTTGNQNVDVADFTSGDAIGLGGVFENQGELNRSLTVDCDDLVMTLPDGQEVRFIGGAGLKDQMAELVIDFKSDQQVDNSLDHVFSGLTDQQIVEIYDQVPDFGHCMVEAGNWQNLEDVLARNDSAPSEPAPSPEPDPLPTPAPPEEPEVPVPTPREDQPYPPYDDDNYVPDHPVDDPQDYGSASGGGCFVATAAFGDRMHPDVVALRIFRDHHLVRTAAGRSFVRLYWIVGPRLAAVTKPHQLHAAMFRRLLTGAVIVLRLLGKTTPSR